MSIGNKIKKIREFKNLTQEHVANKLGVSQSNYARMEKDEIKVTDIRLKQIAEILQVKEDDIKNLEDSVIFNITGVNNSAAGQNCIVNNYHISPEIQKLYEDKIKLLEEKIQWLEGKEKGVEK